MVGGDDPGVKREGVGREPGPFHCDCIGIRGLCSPCSLTRIDSDANAAVAMSPGLESAAGLRDGIDTRTVTG